MSESVIEAGLERQRERQRQMDAKRAVRKERKESSQRPAVVPPEGVEAEPAPAESADEEDEVEEVEVIQPDYRPQTDEELIRDWLRKTTRRDAETPTLRWH
jgi:hypothetical protein